MTSLRLRDQKFHQNEVKFFHFLSLSFSKILVALLGAMFCRPTVLLYHSVTQVSLS